MTVTKRISSEQKDASDKAIKGPISPTSESSKSALLKNKQKPKVEISSHVIVKLVSFSLAVLFLPIAAYFSTLKYVFNGESLYSAILAAVVANIVVGIYVAVAVWEDQESQEKKDQ
ncbi:vacuolar ATPase assembly integral membrane protein vma21 [Entomophthora muscae]|uniref:Vacuolar ATPase assembly integral membrane protein vma21 n=1 Tax=Entomophthora muscae TaxID=34485 RepID=A0ACC2UUE6_9FUNG|nr:vacuolar ATPase assembly integral membrane protein vma21 [Entomophthora muscae]